MNPIARRNIAPTPAAVFDQVRSRVLAFDGAGYASLFAPDAVVEFPFGVPGLPGRLEGRDQIRRYVSSKMELAVSAGRRFLAYHDLVIHQTLDPEVIVVEFEAEGEDVSNDRQYRLRYLQIFRIRDGLIVSMRDYVDTLRLAKMVSS
jgi:ketosteroid isomerase-like protein